RSLPPQTLSPEFSQQVLQALASRNAEVAPRPVLRIRSSLPAWVSVATAATVLLGIGLGSYVYFGVANRHHSPEFAWVGDRAVVPGQASQAAAKSRDNPAPVPQPEHYELLQLPAPEALAKAPSSPPVSG